MGKKYIFEVEDETQLIVEIGVNSTGAAVITTKHPKYLTPYEEPDLDAIRNEAYEKGVQDTKQHWVDASRSFAYKLGYENGLNDAWDAARKIPLTVNEGGLSANALTMIFGNKSIIQIFKELSASEVVEKIRQYEQAQEKQEKAKEAEGLTEGRWIPVTERLPEEDGNYLVTFDRRYAEEYALDDIIGIAPFEVDCEGFGIWQEDFHPETLGSLGSDWVDIQVTAWRPLPEAFEKEEES